MSDLYVRKSGSTDWWHVKASRSDVLKWLGWEKCPNYNVTDHSECNCLSGLVPPASQVEAVAREIDKGLEYDTNYVEWHRESTGMSVTHWARAALIAAMREGVGDE